MKLIIKSYVKYINYLPLFSGTHRRVLSVLCSPSFTSHSKMAASGEFKDFGPLVGAIDQGTSSSRFLVSQQVQRHILGELLRVPFGFLQIINIVTDLTYARYLQGFSQKCNNNKETPSLISSGLTRKLFFTLEIVILRFTMIICSDKVCHMSMEIDI